MTAVVAIVAAVAAVFVAAYLHPLLGLVPLNLGGIVALRLGYQNQARVIADATRDRSKNSSWYLGPGPRCRAETGRNLTMLPLRSCSFGQPSAGVTLMNLEIIAVLTPPQLADLANVAHPDGPTSAGALFLAEVRDEFLAEARLSNGGLLDEAVLRLDLPQDVMPGRFDEIIATMSDLACWDEHLGSDTRNAGEAARASLELVAERLAFALAERAGITIKQPAPPRMRGDAP